MREVRQDVGEAGDVLRGADEEELTRIDTATRVMGPAPGIWVAVRPSVPANHLANPRDRSKSSAPPGR